MDTTSPTLLDRLRNPNGQAAWTRFVNLYGPLLLAWARRLGLQESDASDLVQEVFALLVHKLPDFQYDPARSFRAWLKTVAMNQWRAGLRRRAKAPAMAHVETDEVPAAEAEGFWEHEYRQHLVARALQLMQNEFEPNTWKACWECVVNDRPAPEVAMELGLSPGAVRVAKFRVLSRLRQELEGMLD